MIVALAFVPIPDLNDAFVSLVGSFPEELETELLSVADWFEDNYLGRERKGHRRSPLFPSSIWCV